MIETYSFILLNIETLTRFIDTMRFERWCGMWQWHESGPDARSRPGLCRDMQSRCRADAEQMQSTEIHFVPGLKIDYIWVRERTQDRADCQRVLVPNCLNCVVKIGFNICRIHSWKSQLLQDFQAELFFDEASRRCLATSFYSFSSCCDNRDEHCRVATSRSDHRLPQRLWSNGGVA